MTTTRPTPIKFVQEVPQGNTCLIEFTLTDYDGVTPVSVAAVTAATLTLLDKDTDAIINERSAVDVRTKLGTNGRFSMLLSADDNVIVNPDERVDEEVHVALITITAAGAEAPITFKREFWITVLNQREVANESPA